MLLLNVYFNKQFFTHVHVGGLKCLAPGPEVIKLFSCSTQPRLIFILLINVKMPTVANSCWHFNIYEQDKLLVFEF